MKRGSKNKNELKEKIKSWVFVAGFIIGMMMMGGESEDLSTIWVNILGAVILFGTAWLTGAFKEEQKGRYGRD